MLNAATSSATAANTVSPVDRKPRKPLLMSSRFSVASCVPVMACTPARQQPAAAGPRARRPAPRARPGPGSGSPRPGRSGPGAACAACSVIPVNVAGPKPSAVPKVAMPTMCTRTGCGVSSVVVVAERQVPGLRRAAVDDDLVVGPRGVPRDQAVRVQRGVGDPVRRLGRRPVAADRLAVAAQQLPVALQVGLGVGDAGHGPHPRQQARVDAGARRRGPEPISVALRTTTSVPRRPG